jgi:hypothetical protein
MKLLQTVSGVVGITAWMAVKNRSAQRIMGLLACLVLSASGASAATLNVVGGELLGASGVIVDGSSYDVEFLRGSCIALYNGCDSSSDFTFKTETVALLAAEALLDQVFIDDVSRSFDSSPKLTAGCTIFTFCNVLTPYLVIGGGTVWVGTATNGDGATALDSVFIGDNAVDVDYGMHPAIEYAVWNPVPEPNAALLIAMGLAGLGWRGRAKRA